MAEETLEKRIAKTDEEMYSGNDCSEHYVRDFLALRNAIIENCKDCIRDCGGDCLDREARPMENVRCPLQKVRIDYRIAIKDQDPEFSSWGRASSDSIILQ